MAKVPGAAQIGQGPSLRDPGVNAPAAAFDMGGGALQAVGGQLQDKFARIAVAEQKRKDAIGRARADRTFEERSTDLLRTLEQADDPTDPEAQQAFNLGLEALATELSTSHSNNPDSQAALYSAFQPKLSKFYAQAGTIAATHTRRIMQDQLVEARSTGVNAVAQDPDNLFGALQGYQEKLDLMRDGLSPTEYSEAQRQATDLFTKTALTTMIRRGQNGEVKRILATDPELVEMLDPQTVVDLRVELDAFDKAAREDDMEFNRAVGRARRIYGPNASPEQIASVMGYDVPSLDLVEVVGANGDVIRLPARQAVGMKVPQDTDSDPLISVVDPNTGTAVLRRESQAEGMTPATNGIEAPVAVLNDAGETVYVTRAQAVGMRVPPKTPNDPLVAVLGEDGNPVFKRSSEAEGMEPADPGQLVAVENPDGTRTWRTRAQARGEAAPEQGPLVSIGGDQEKARAKKFGEVVGTAEAERITTALDRGEQARNDLVEMGRIKEAIAGGTFQTGSFAETRQAIAQFARLMGPGAAETVEGIVGSAATADNIRAATKKLALNEVPNLGRTLKAGLQLIQETLPDLAMTPEGNLILIEVMERVANRQIEVARIAETYMELGTTTPDGAPSYREALEALEAGDPILTDELKQRIRRGAQFGRDIGLGGALDDSIHPDLRTKLGELGFQKLPEWTHTAEDGRKVIILNDGSIWSEDGTENLTPEAAPNE